MNDPLEAKPVSELSNLELQRVIAKLRGYTLTECYGVWGVALQGENIPEGYIGNGSQEEAEQYMWREVIPMWSQDTHAACVDLLAETSYSLAYGHSLNKWYILDMDKFVVSEYAHPARAICIAWVLWKRGEA